MDVPEVDGKLLRELESMGFLTAGASRALYSSGNRSLEEAINWIIEHENDPDIDQMPLVSINIEIESGKPSSFPEEVKMKVQELRERAHKRKFEEEKILETEREKERMRTGKALIEARRIEEENERRLIALRKAERQEENRARERIRQRLEADKAERRQKLGLSPKQPVTRCPKPPVTNGAATATVQEMKSSLTVKTISKAESMRNCLRYLKKNHKDDDDKVTRAFQTLLRYVGNVVKNPDEEKFRKIRLSNPTFQDRVGSLKGGIEFLELCGFEKVEGNGFLYMPRDKVDMKVLNLAGTELYSAMTNPFFGVL